MLALLHVNQETSEWWSGPSWVTYPRGSLSSHGLVRALGLLVLLYRARWLERVYEYGCTRLSTLYLARVLVVALATLDRVSFSWHYPTRMGTVAHPQPGGIYGMVRAFVGCPSDLLMGLLVCPRACLHQS